MPARSRSEPPLPSEMAFVVQFAADTDAPEGRFMGRVEHVVSGRATHFDSWAALQQFLERVLITVRATPPADPLEEPGSDATLS
jgi:hypothetical protein